MYIINVLSTCFVLTKNYFEFESKPSHDCINMEEAGIEFLETQSYKPLICLCENLKFTCEHRKEEINSLKS